MAARWTSSRRRSKSPTAHREQQQPKGDPLAHLFKQRIACGSALGVHTVVHPISCCAVAPLLHCHTGDNVHPHLLRARPCQWPPYQTTLRRHGIGSYGALERASWTML